MLHSILNSLKTDFKYIVRNLKLLSALLGPVIIIIILKLIFPLISDFIFSKTGFILDNYYSLVAITFVAIIPALIGIIYANIFQTKIGLFIPKSEAVTQETTRNFLYMRILFSSLLSLVLVAVTIFLTSPVPSEGWLRTLFAAILFSIQTPFIFLFIVALSERRRAGFTLTWLYWVFLMALPLGLLLHHPWNYFTFFSPFYWIAWAWIEQSSVDSMIYGAIALIMTSVLIIIFFRHLLRRHAS